MENTTNVLFDVYRVTVGLTDEMLGTNPFNLNVMDTHIIDRQRKLIADNSQVNKSINKYLDAKAISVEDANQELKALRNTISEVLGAPITDEEFEHLKEGDFDKIANLRESMKELDEKGITCFFRNPEDNKTVCIGSHMILGFLKAAGEAISKTLPKKNGKVLHSASYTSGLLNQHVTITPKFINASKDILREESGKPQYLQRSLRAMTAQGPRISLAKSEVLPKETAFSFEIKVMKNSQVNEDVLKTMLSYGELKGLGQWRNAGKGQFEVVEFSKQ